MVQLTTIIHHRLQSPETEGGASSEANSSPTQASLGSGSAAVFVRSVPSVGPKLAANRHSSVPLLSQRSGHGLSWNTPGQL
jgi:hypothetical protein